MSPSVVVDFQSPGRVDRRSEPHTYTNKHAGTHKRARADPRIHILYVRKVKPFSRETALSFSPARSLSYTPALCSLIAHWGAIGVTITHCAAHTLNLIKQRIYDTDYL